MSSARAGLPVVLLLLASLPARATAPPAVDVTSPVTFTLTQGSFSTQIQAVERAESAASFYDYFSASSHTGFETALESKTFLYRDTTTGLLSLFFTHGIDFDTSGIPTGNGAVTFDLSGVPPGTFVAQSDDPFQGGRPELDLGLEPEGDWNYGNNTDGGVLDGLPTDQPWCLTITPLLFMNIDSWVYHYSSGASITLDRTLPVTICFEPAVDLDVLDVDEGNDVSLSGSFDDPDAGDSHVATWDFGDGGGAGTTFTPGPGFTHHDCDPVFHAYGDDGEYLAVLTVDDGVDGAGSDSITVRVHGVPPSLTLGASFVTGVGIGLNIPAQGHDPGSDDLSFTWNFGDGSPTETRDHFNDGVGPDGMPSPGGTFPFDANDVAHHAWCEPGLYTMTVQLEDDDGLSTLRTATVQVLSAPAGTECNQDPACGAGPDLLAACGTLSTGATASDPDGDPLTFSWTSSCPGTAFLPHAGVLAPDVLLPGGCDVTCTLTLLVTDGQGGSCSDSVQARLHDDVAPSITTCPVAEVAECGGSGNAAARDAWIASFAATDACGGVTITSTASVELRCGGGSVETRTFRATDACGNVASCTSTFTVADTTPPSVVAGAIAACYPSVADAEAAALAATEASDACSGLVTLGVSTTGGCAATITVVASDACGNSASVTHATRVDSEAPVLSGVPPSATVACDAVPPPATPAATDACEAAPIVAFSETTEPGPCPQSSTITRTWTATDACGNASSATQVLTVQDVAAPVISGVPANAIVSCDAVPAPATPSASDACDASPAMEFAEVQSAGPCPQSWTLTRTWTATDACGNASSATQVLTVQDVVAPALSGVPVDATVDCDAVPIPATPSAADSCDPAPLVAFAEARVDGPCAGTYRLTRTWTATDACGNAASQSQVLSVVDREPPIVQQSLDPVACLWPPNHRMVAFSKADFSPAIRDACSEPVTWVFTGCASDQPDDGIGDGATTADCVVAPDGGGFAVRAERQGPEPPGRRYLVRIVATDGCGNSSADTIIGTILVPHDQAPHEDCISATGRPVGSTPSRGPSVPRTR